MIIWLVIHGLINIVLGYLIIKHEFDTEQNVTVGDMWVNGCSALIIIFPILNVISTGILVIIWADYTGWSHRIDYKFHKKKS